MSDLPANTEPAADPSLGPRRLVAFIIAFVLGAVVIGVAIRIFLNADPITATFPIAFLNDVPLLPLATLPMGFFFLIWLDYFMGTKIIPD